MKQILASLLVIILCALSAASAERLPNFVVIFVDDLGYADIGS